MIDLMEEKEVYLAEFSRFEKELGDRAGAWPHALRTVAIERFAELGFPTIKDEDWRFTNVAPIAKLPFKPVFEYSRGNLDAAAINRYSFASLKGDRNAGVVHKMRLAMMVHGVDFSSHPGGVVSATHGEAELEDTVAAMRNSVRMLKAEGEL